MTLCVSVFSQILSAVLAILSISSSSNQGVSICITSFGSLFNHNLCKIFPGKTPHVSQELRKCPILNGDIKKIIKI